MHTRSCGHCPLNDSPTVTTGLVFCFAELATVLHQSSTSRRKHNVRSCSNVPKGDKEWNFRVETVSTTPCPSETKGFHCYQKQVRYCKFGRLVSNLFIFLSVKQCREWVHYAHSIFILSALINITANIILYLSLRLRVLVHVFLSDLGFYIRY